MDIWNSSLGNKARSSYANRKGTNGFLNFLFITGVIIGLLAFVVGLYCLMGLLVSVCWNYIASYFNGPHITWWMGTVIYFLCSLLFKGGGTNTTQRKS